MEPKNASESPLYKHGPLVTFAIGALWVALGVTVGFVVMEVSGSAPAGVVTGVVTYIGLALIARQAVKYDIARLQH